VDGLDPISRWRHTLDRPYYLMREVADDLQVTSTAIRTRCLRFPYLGPAQIGSYHGRDVWLFTPAETEALRADFAERPLKIGRPRVWSAEEARDRDRRRTRRSYWLGVAEMARIHHRPAREQQAQGYADELDRGLRLQRPASLEE